MKPVITIPRNAKVYEFTNSDMWFDEDGILWSVSKKAPPQTIEQARKDIERLKSMIGDNKVCMLADVTHSTEITREMREFAAEELPKITKAIAMVSGSALGRMFANLFFSIKSQPYPVKMFNKVEDARTWLLQYL